MRIKNTREKKKSLLQDALSRHNHKSGRERGLLLEKVRVSSGAVSSEDFVGASHMTLNNVLALAGRKEGGGGGETGLDLGSRPRRHRGGHAVRRRLSTGEVQEAFFRTGNLTKAGVEKYSDDTGKGG